MFELLNSYRAQASKHSWKVISVTGEDLVATLSKEDPQESLLVIPAGQSSNLDKVFSVFETTFLMDNFFKAGGRGWLNCGSAYWASKMRIYDDVCIQYPNRPKRVQKESKLPLFEGTAVGPLCKYPGAKYKVGFFSDSIDVTDGEKNVTIFLSGGGSFVIPKNSKQNVKVLVRYAHKDLSRLGKMPTQFPEWENAAIITQIGKGAALMSMFHPYYGSQDIDSDYYERNFPNSGTNWRKIHASLSSVDQRMQFVMRYIAPLEQMSF